MPEKEELNIVMKEGDILKKKEFHDNFKRVIQIILETQKKFSQSLQDLTRKHNELVDELKSGHSKSLSDLKGQVNDLFVKDRLSKMDSDSKSMFSTLKSELLKSLDLKVKDVDFKVSSIKPIKGDRGDRGVPGPMPTEHLDLLKETKEELRKAKDILSNRSRGWLGSGQSVIVPRPLSNIIPAGSINGVNKDFTLPKEPKKDGERVYLNGVRMRSGASNDYTVLGRVITFNTAPLTNDVILCDIDF